MKWFKHFSDAHDDEKLSEVLCIHGPGAYGVFWLIVESIAAQMDETNKCEVRYHIKKWAGLLHVDRRTLAKYLQTFDNLTLLVLHDCDNFVTIKIPKLLKLRDNYTKDLQAPKKKTTKQEVEVEVEEEEDHTGGALLAKIIELVKPDFPMLTPSQLKALKDWIGKGKTLKDIQNALIKTAGSQRSATRWGWIVDEMNKVDKPDKPKKGRLRK